MAIKKLCIRLKWNAKYTKTSSFISIMYIRDYQSSLKKYFNPIQKDIRMYFEFQISNILFQLISSTEGYYLLSLKKNVTNWFYQQVLIHNILFTPSAQLFKKHK